MTSRRFTSSRMGLCHALVALITLSLLPGKPLAAQSTSPAGRMTGISTGTRFTVYYGGDYSETVVADLAGFDVVVLDPISKA